MSLKSCVTVVRSRSVGLYPERIDEREERGEGREGREVKRGKERGEEYLGK